MEDTIKMLYGLRDRYEAHHKVHFSDEALVAAARFPHSMSWTADCLIRQLT